MGAFADSLFAVLMSWVRALVNGLWALFSSERTTVLEFLGKNWLMIVIVLVAAGLVIDWLIWLIRWRPYTLWAQRARRLLRLAPEDEDEEDEDLAPTLLSSMTGDVQEDEPDEDDGEWLPEQPAFDEADTQQAMERAEAVPDEELGLYPGMRYDEQTSLDMEEGEMGGTRRYAAVSAVSKEGPGAAEVSRRREEIDAYKRQLEEEARLERERRMEALRRAEEERAAQEEYARQLVQYERQKAQYELELAQYQRDMAAYEAALAAQNTQEASAQQTDTEAAQELAPKTAGRTRARRRPVTYSDMIEGETVETLPETPQWPKMDKAVSEVKKSVPQKTPAKKSALAMRMAHLIEPEEAEISGVNALPPRVDPKAAYKPAAKPENAQKRRRK